MSVLAHLGIEHPNLAWLLASALVAFFAGLGVNVYQSTRGGEPIADAASSDAASSDDGR